jgi:hypothetical protein
LRETHDRQNAAVAQGDHCTLLKLHQSNPLLGSEEPEVRNKILVMLRKLRMGLNQLSQLLR